MTHNRPLTGKEHFEALRNAGFDFDTATRGAGLSRKYTIHLENLRNREAGSMVNVIEPMNHDARHVEALLAAGGYHTLSEKLTRQGHVACLPLVPFEARP